MAKKSKHVRRFLNAARQRLADAAPLRSAVRTLAAVYLAGYTVECVLKALVLSTYPEHEQKALTEGVGDEGRAFRGKQGHDLEGLLRNYRERGGASPSADVTAALVSVRAWKTDLRYDPNSRYDGDSDGFMAAAEVVCSWAERSV